MWTLPIRHSTALVITSLTAGMSFSNILDATLSDRPVWAVVWTVFFLGNMFFAIVGKIVIDDGESPQEKKP